jgi:predicted nucleic acid-binding protein
VRIPHEFRLDAQRVEIHRNADGDLVLADGCTLVTNNTGEFERVQALKLENWAV